MASHDRRLTAQSMRVNQSGRIHTSHHVQVAHEFRLPRDVARCAIGVLSDHRDLLLLIPPQDSIGGDDSKSLNDRGIRGRGWRPSGYPLADDLIIRTLWPETF